MATSIFSGHKLKNNKVFISFALLFVSMGRIILVLPFCEQPRFEINNLHWIIGGLIIALSSLIIIVPIFVVRWWAPPVKGMKLITSGIYRYIRHPIYFFEVMWFLGLAIMFRSLYAVYLAPVFWFIFFIHALAEEAELENVLGNEYIEYKRKVPGRIFPFLPL